MMTHVYHLLSFSYSDSLTNTYYVFLVIVLYFTDFHVSVLAKLDTIIDNQQEQLMLLRQIAAGNKSCGSAEALDEIIPTTINTVEELLDFDKKLRDVEFKKKMVGINAAFLVFL